jgi:hypothetical protein
MSDSEEWAKGFARQAQADFETWGRLQGLPETPECHRLLFLQMACEKLTKAHLCKAGSNPAAIQSSHAYVARNLPIIIRQQISITNPKNAAWVLKHSEHLAREIEMLAPAVKRGGRRLDNCEYPWEDEGGRLHVPLDWTFTPSSLLMAPAGRTIIKLARDAINRLA